MVGQQFPREASLQLISAAAPNPTALDMSDLRFTFRIVANDTETPNTAYIRVYNLSEQTRQRAIKEFDTVVLQAGYETNSATIFKGTVKQFKRGKESNVDSFLDIYAADSDSNYNFSFINQTLPAGSSPAQELNLLGQSLGVPIDPDAFLGLTGGILPKGKVLFGLTKYLLREFADSQLSRWSIQQGVLTLIPLAGVLVGQAIVVNSLTGMVGVPESTDQGIQVRMLLNPQVQVGGKLQINNADITQTIVRQQFFPSYTSAPTMVADVTADGLYRVLVVEHTGDTRGQEWYTDVTCLSLDGSSPLNPVPFAFGG